MCQFWELCPHSKTAEATISEVIFANMPNGGNSLANTVVAVIEPAILGLRRRIRSLDGFQTQTCLTR